MRNHKGKGPADTGVLIGLIDRLMALNIRRHKSHMALSYSAYSLMAAIGR